MNHQQRAAAVWIVFGLILISAVWQLITTQFTGGEEGVLAQFSSALAWSISPVIFGLVGALIISRHPDNVIGLLLMLPALVFAIPVETYLRNYPAAPATPSPFLLLILWFGEWGWLLLVMPVLFILVLFPTGRPLTARWRWLIAIGLGMSAAFVLFATFAQELGPVSGDNLWRVTNPIGFIPSNWFDDYLLGPWFVLLPLLTIGCAAALFVRFRRAAVVEREQIKWLFYAGLLFAAVYVPTFLPNPLPDDVWNTLFAFALLAFPIAIGMAIIRYRLFDIDIIIRRTLVYGLLTAILLAVYFGMVLLAQTAFVALTGEQSPIAIVLSTLAIAALFNPLRRTIQDFINRRFYRRNYDAVQTLAHFAQTARDETNLQALTSELSRAVQATLQPRSLTLWLPPDPNTQSLPDHVSGGRE